MNNMRPVESYIRLMHASPDAPAVDVYANEKLIAKSLSYRGFTEYLKLTPDKYTVKVFAAGQTANPIITTDIVIPVQKIFTLAISGKLAKIALLEIPEPEKEIPSGKLFLRLGHLSPDAPDLDLVLADGTKLFSNVLYKKVSEYLAVFPGMYTFYLRPAFSDKNLLYVPNIQLLPNKFYTIYAVGLVTGTPSLQVLIPLDGNTYL